MRATLFSRTVLVVTVCLGLIGATAGSPRGEGAGEEALLMCVMEQLQRCANQTATNMTTDCRSLNWVYDCINSFEDSQVPVQSTIVTTCVDVLWVGVRGLDCVDTCRSVQMEAVRGLNTREEGDNATLCSVTVGDTIYAGVKRRYPNVCQYVYDPVPALQTYDAAAGLKTDALGTGYNCACLPRKGDTGSRAAAVWRPNKRSCRGSQSVATNLCRVKSGGEYYMGWRRNGECNYYTPANGIPDALPAASNHFDNLCVPNRFSYVHPCEQTT